MSEMNQHQEPGVLVGTIITCLNAAPRAQRKNGLAALDGLVEQLEIALEKIAGHHDSDLAEAPPSKYGYGCLVCQHIDALHSNPASTPKAVNPAFSVSTEYDGSGLVPDPYQERERP